MMKLSLVIQAIDRITGPLRRIQNAFRVMTTRGAADTAKLNRMMLKLGKTVESVGRAIGTSIRLGALAAIGGTVALGKGVMETGIQFENFEATLTTTLKSAAKARQAMSWIQDFSARTPFELDEVTKAFVNLTGFGIEPTERVMTSMGNTAAVFKGMGKTLDDVVQAVADAQNGGGFERLNEFGIKGRKDGKSVFLEYATQSGRVRRKVVDDANAIREAILDAMDANYAGGMGMLSKTFSGRLSNLADMWTNFKLSIAKAGVFDWANKRLAKFLDFLNTAKGKAASDAWAKRISDGLIRMGEALISINWGQVARSIAAIAAAILSVASVIATMGGGGLDGLFNMAIVGVIIRITTGLGGLAAALGVVTVAGLPLWGVVAVVAALAAGAFLIWRNWSKLPGWFQQIVRAAMVALAPLQAVINVLVKGWKWLVSAPVPGYGRGATAQDRARATAAARATPQSPPQPLDLRSGRQRALDAARHRAEVAVTIKTDAGTQARVTKLQSSSRDLKVDVLRGAIGFG